MKTYQTVNWLFLKKIKVETFIVVVITFFLQNKLTLY